jgi:sortase A
MIRVGRAAALRRAERLLFAVAAAAFVYYAVAHIGAVREQHALSRELERSLAAAPAAGPAPPRLAARALVGRIEVSRIELSALAREGVDTRTLRGAVGHVPGTALPGERGNAAFAAHRDTFFRPLKYVRAGDEVAISTPSGVYRYVVTNTRVVMPSDVEVLAPTPEATLTLVTCYPFDYVGSAPKRFIVTARLQSEGGARTASADMRF